LELLPGGLFNDEAASGNDAYKSLINVDYHAFYTDHNGREGMLIWLISIVLFFLEPSAFSVRFAPALIGLVTVMVLPFTAKKILTFTEENDPEKNTHFIRLVALSSMFFICVSFWHINFSRIAFRAIIDPLFASLAVALFLHAIKSGVKVGWSLITGLVLGFGQYGYGSFKFMVIPFAFLIWISVWNIHLKRRFVKITLMLTTALLSFAPLLFFIINHPVQYFQRLGTLSIFNQSSPIFLFFKGLFKTISMLFFEGDMNARHNIPGYPALHFLVFLFFLFGVFVLINAARRKNEGGLSFDFVSRNSSLLLIIWWVNIKD